MTFLRNTWYVAGYAREANGKPFVRTLLGEPVMMFRTSAGDLVAMEDRCPHRFAPLHRGRVVDDAIQCPYHGLRFDRSGACVGMPLGGEPPPRAHLKTYPIVERHRMLWIWMGDAGAADPALIPDFGLIAEEGVDWFEATLYARANYQLLIDNLLDLSHSEFLHPMLSSAGWASRNVATVDQQGDTITITNVAENDNILPIMAMFKPHLNPVGKTVQVERWDPPALLRLSVDYFTDNGEFLIPSAHFLTPETERTTHYFVLGAQTVDPSDPALTRQFGAGVEAVFKTEDIPLIEAQQAYMGDAELMELEPAILKSDAGAVRVRRHLAKLIRLERAALENRPHLA